ncbi:enoyl-CoA hydratase/isomerase family protein [Rhizobium deserti]|uniref:3-hydroxyisobutyryl-CoA hydrolase n=1 Tax=Rhizobium deserti TaxID=2547961 RepID=A0A4V3APY4_9HYPH|nr:enoyl-CoA hydratase/isomerase family protein [Rhizobium deserti]TDK39560.1 enoyl-CoA hydratase/isomerase family protein [Rhizobium deserti]
MPEAAIPSPEVIIDRVGSAGIIRLNRPKALNSLTLSMVRAMKAAMHDFAEDDTVATVVLVGEGERGLCAGGDIRAIHDMGRAGDPDVTQFWREEFPINYAIAHYPKPYVALMDGIVMGGGVGIASHGKHRVVTGRTRLAMPETGIGYVPDVGATWLLPRAPGETGTWMGLTGQEIGAADAIYARLADACLSSDDLPALIEALGGLGGSASDSEVRAVIDGFAVQPAGGKFATQQALINRCFRFDTVEEILEALRQEEGEFAARTRDVILKRSPTSLKLTLRLLRLGRNSSSLVECLEREFTAASEILKNHDFYEGVRAAIIDKDRNPQWWPGRLEEVNEADLEGYFTSRHPVLFADHRL